MLEITRYNPFTGDESEETFDVDSISEMQSLPFIADAVAHGWEVFQNEEFIYIRLKGSTLRVASIRERKINGTG